jgi:hypothetical protein
MSSDIQRDCDAAHGYAFETEWPVWAEQNPQG